MDAGGSCHASPIPTFLLGDRGFIFSILFHSCLEHVSFPSPDTLRAELAPVIGRPTDFALDNETMISSFFPLIPVSPKRTICISSRRAGGASANHPQRRAKNRKTLIIYGLTTPGTPRRTGVGADYLRGNLSVRRRLVRRPEGSKLHRFFSRNHRRDRHIVRPRTIRAETGASSLRPDPICGEMVFAGSGLVGIVYYRCRRAFGIPLPRDRNSAVRRVCILSPRILCVFWDTLPFRIGPSRGSSGEPGCR